MLKEKHINDILDKMFEMVGVNRDEIDTTKDDWFLEHTWTEEEQQKFIDWTSNYIHKNLRVNKKQALKTAQFLNLDYGWKVKYETK